VNSTPHSISKVTRTVRFALLSGMACASAAAAELPFVSSMFGNNMILQQGKTNIV